MQLFQGLSINVQKEKKHTEAHRFKIQRFTAFSLLVYVWEIFFKVTEVSYGFILLISSIENDDDDISNFIKANLTKAVLWIEWFNLSFQFLVAYSALYMSS